MIIRIALTALLFILSLVNTGCDTFKGWFAREFMQETLADGLARISVPTLSMILSEINKKFESDDAKVVITENTDPKGYGKGEGVWTIRDLTLSYPNETVIYTDCTQEKFSWRGKAHIISATMWIEGRLTGNKATPVIPDINKVVIKVRARLENLAVRFVGRDNYIVMDEGEVEFEAFPRLAQKHKEDPSTAGLRIVPTSNMRFSQVRLKNIKARLFTADVKMPVEIDDSNLNIQVGVGEKGEENSIHGQISIFGREHLVPSDGQGLDPEYDRKEFEKKFLCKYDELLGRATYANVSFEEKIAPPIAGLSTLLTGLVAEKLENNALCGMASPDVMARAVFESQAGNLGKVLYSLQRPCRIDFNRVLTTPDCFGKTFTVRGSVTITAARKEIEGLILTNPLEHAKAVMEYRQRLNLTRLSPENPEPVTNIPKPKSVVPGSRMPVRLGIDIDFNGLTVKESCAQVHNKTHPQHCANIKEEGFEYTIHSGHVSADLKPMLAKVLDPSDEQYGFCSIPSQVTKADVNLSNIKSSLKKGDNNINVLANGTYEVIRGPINGKENELAGSLQINDVTVPFATKDRAYVVLDPYYDRSNFFDSFLSCGNIELPISDSDCNPDNGLAINVARLLVLNAGALAKVAAPGEVSGFLGLLGDIRNGRLENNDTRLVIDLQRSQTVNLEDFTAINSTTDFIGDTMKLFGSVLNFNGKLQIEGRPQNWMEFFSGLRRGNELRVRPISPDATTFTLNAAVNNFATKLIIAGHRDPEPYLVLRSGQFKIKAIPYMGEDRRQPGSFSIQTPIVKFEEIIVENASAILKGGGLDLPIYIKKAVLKAMNGFYAGQGGNYIHGTIQFKPYSLADSVPVDFDPPVVIRDSLKTPLNPNYNQDLFNRSYQATPHLLRPLPWVF